MSSVGLSMGLGWGLSKWHASISVPHTSPSLLIALLAELPLAQPPPHGHSAAPHSKQWSAFPPLCPSLSHPMASLLPWLHKGFGGAQGQWLDFVFQWPVGLSCVGGGHGLCCARHCPSQLHSECTLWQNQSSSWSLCKERLGRKCWGKGTRKETIMLEQKTQEKMTQNGEKEGKLPRIGSLSAGEKRSNLSKGCRQISNWTGRERRIRRRL